MDGRPSPDNVEKVYDSPDTLRGVEACREGTLAADDGMARPMITH